MAISKKRRRPPVRQSEESGKQAFFSSTQEEPAYAQSSPGAFFQAKLEIGSAYSASEKEADEKAEEIVNGTQHNASTTTSDSTSVQRETKEKKEEPAAKLIQKQDDKKEKPAAKLIQKQDDKKEEPAAKLIQKQDDKKEKPMGKKKAPGESEKKKNEPPNLENLIQKTKGEGMALPDDVLAEMETAFKADLSQVRIHTGPIAVQMTQMINAHAFTHGYDIYFNQARFDPRSDKGKRLLAHELTHVVQQKGR